MSLAGIDPSWPEPARRLIESLQQRVADLEAKLEGALRAKKRQASPFGKPRKKNPKRPGRKRGPDHGGAKFRAPPEKVDRILDAPLPPNCDECGGEIREERVDHQFLVDVPAKIELETTQFDIHIGACDTCGSRHQGRHPDQTSDALGNARWQIGPRILSFATYLNKVAGVPYAKIAAFFAVVFSLTVQPSTLVRAMTRMGRKLEGAYEVIHSQIQNSEVIYPDETGWRVGGAKSWMWVFVAPMATLYRIAVSRGYDVASWALGENFAGFLGHDGWSVYDQFKKAIHQTCLNHLITRCKRLVEVAVKRSVSFPRELKAVLQDSLALRDRAESLSPHGFLIALGRLKARLRRVLQMKLSYPPNVRLAKHIRRHVDQIFTFLEHPAVEATNHHAEQAIRPAVLIRKVGGCNKSWRGAHAHEVLLTFFRTARQRGADALASIVEALRHRSDRTSFVPGFLKDS